MTTTACPPGRAAARPARRAGHQHRRPGLRRVGDPGRDLPAGARRRGFRGQHPDRRWLPRPAVRGVRLGRRQPGPRLRGIELEFLNENAGEATGDVDETFDLLQPLLEERGLVGLEPSDAVDTNAFVVTQETADELGLASLSDLAEKGADLTLGAPQDCETNPFCIPGLREVYGLDMSSNFTPLDAGVVLTSLQEGAIDVGLLFSTDGRIASEGLVLLEDDKNMLAADNVFPVAVPGAGRRLRRRT